MFFWKRMPALRLVVPLMLGIVLQVYTRFTITQISVALAFLLIALIIFNFIGNKLKLALSICNGLLSLALMMLLGAALVWKNDIRNDKRWIGNSYIEEAKVLVTLQEPPATKENSWKANAEITAIINGQQLQRSKGKIIVYFSKEFPKPVVDYGSQILIAAKLQPIKNLGNPGGFDYKRYCLFNGITHQVVLKNKGYKILPDVSKNKFRELLFRSQKWVLGIIEKYIPGSEEKALAEALLIGYKNNLERPLIQSYTNTGVIHIIAISGLHLGIIYWLLSKLFSTIIRNKKLYWLPPLLTVVGLWFFSFLVGAQASVIRSAVMFTCFAFGAMLQRKGNIYNTIAVSGLILLIINPYWLWDVGFQLSYAAVLSIIIFMRPIYKKLIFTNKIVDFFWQMTAISLAAQILTLPISFYHFHQFPTYFILSNFISVPLSSLILLIEIMLCALCFLPPAALLLGKLISILMAMMTSGIRYIESFPYSLIDALQQSLLQIFLLYAIIILAAIWCLTKIKAFKQYTLLGTLVYTIVLLFAIFSNARQKKIIVYNVPQHQAVDFIAGDKYFFVGDSSLIPDDFLRNFHLKPSRTLHQVKPADTMPRLAAYGKEYIFYNKRIVFANEDFTSTGGNPKPVIDILVVSKSREINLQYLAQRFAIRQVVADGTIPYWSVPPIEQQCSLLNIPFYYTANSGAFEMQLD